MATSFLTSSYAYPAGPYNSAHPAPLNGYYNGMYYVNGTPVSFGAPTPTQPGEAGNVAGVSTDRSLGSYQDPTPTWNAGYGVGVEPEAATANPQLYGGAPIGAPAPNQTQTPTPQPVYLEGTGRWYDLANNLDRVAYFNDRGRLVQEASDRSLNDTKTKSKSALKAAEDYYGKLLSDIAQSESDYGAGYTKNLTQLGSDYGLNLVKQGALFGRYSPNALQSSQGTLADFLQKKYLEGQGDLANAKARAMDTYAGQRSDLKNSYNQYLSDTADTLTQADQSAKEYVSNEKSTVSQALVPVDYAMGITDFASRYPQDKLNYTAPTVDLSAYTAYPTADALAGAPAAKAKYVPTATTTNPVDSYLGYLPENQKSYIRNYLQRGY